MRERIGVVLYTMDYNTVTGHVGSNPTAPTRPTLGEKMADQKFGVKYEDGDKSLQLNQIFDDSNDAAQAARDLYAKDNSLRDVRVVSADELAPFETKKK